ncbi:hypothetical protein DI09_139p70, partial [Mitosporidium daphniae]
MNNVDLHRRFQSISVAVRKSVLSKPQYSNGNIRAFTSLACKFVHELVTHPDFSHRVVVCEMLVVALLAAFHTALVECSFPDILLVQIILFLILSVLWYFKWRSICRPLANHSKILKICKFLDFLHESVKSNEAVIYPIVFTEPFYPALQFVRIYSNAGGDTLSWIPFDLCSPADLISLNDLLNLSNIDSSVLTQIDHRSKVVKKINGNVMHFCKINAFPLCSKIDILSSKQGGINGKTALVFSRREPRKHVQNAIFGTRYQGISFLCKSIPNLADFFVCFAACEFCLALSKALAR